MNGTIINVSCDNCGVIFPKQLIYINRANKDHDTFKWESK
jgi:hypothetical protein